ncbi:alanine racemase [Bacillus massiliigorillae]|uniref:alanine racemase n=1 Tax=Bacillus massiliigorillae TaxID=1243664 RepID=UPI0003A14C64|nr:alanine racemase [Bacillus massiliigorillae]
MISAFYRDTWIEINLDAIYDNVHSMRQYLRDDVKLGAVVKANGYGHGVIEVAETALKAGADFLVVAILDEAIQLRQAGFQSPILVLGVVRSSDAAVAAQHNISVTVFQHEWLESAINHLPEGAKLSVHIKCDTGMGRLGFRNAEQVKKAEEIIKNSGVLSLTGIFTHFATADELDNTLFQKQYARFTEMVSALSERPSLVHSGNSAASLRFEDTWFNAVRFGISMYGLSPSMEIKECLPFPLKEALSLHTKISHVKQIEKNETVSYGATYKAQEEEWIATIPIGYADGWLRKLQGQEVLIDGKRMPIVGRVCMDQCMVKLPSFYPVGTEVTLIGVDGTELISVDEIAAKLETINYEVICILGRRIPRKYMKAGQVCSVHNDLI